MDLRGLLKLLRRRWLVIVLTTVTSVGVGAGLSFTATPVYTSNVQLFVSAQEDGAGITSAYTGGLFTQQRVSSYTRTASSPRVARLVVENLGLKVSPEELASQISASNPPSTVLIDISVRNSDPALARRIAASFGTVFARFVDEVERPGTGGASPVKLSVVRDPTVPTSPTSPRTMVNILSALVAGLALGVIAAVVRDAIDTRVKDSQQVTEVVGAPVLGTILHDRRATENPLVVHTDMRAPRAEAFRQLRTALQFVSIDHPLRSVIVTSALQGEGKSLTCCNLAISLSQAGVQVALIEADLRRPSLAEYMGLEGSVGLTTVLLGGVSLADALQPWGDGSLSVLTSGALPPNPSELLGGAGMSQLLEQLVAAGYLVIIDAPPLLPVTDAAVLATRTSGALLIVRSHKTRRDELQRATDTLQGVGATILGAVLTMVPTSGADAQPYRAYSRR